MTQYCLITNGIPAEPRLLPFAISNITGFNNISDLEVLATHGFLPFDDTPQPAIYAHQKLDAGLEILDGRVIRTWILRDATYIETENAASIIRAERQKHLIDSDWTQTADAPLNDLARAAWKKYRQELRDITSQVGFPWVITWPTEPSEPYDGIVPDSITRYQAKAELSDIFVDVGGNSIDALTVIEQTIAAQSKPVQIAFNEASVWFRNSPMVLQLAAQFSAMFGWTDADIDNMFRAAALRTA